MKSSLLPRLALFAGTLLAAQAFAQAPLWSKTYNSGFPGLDEPVAIRKAADGTSYMCITAGSSSTIIHLDAAGAQLWAKQVPGEAVAMDANSGGASVLSSVMRRPSPEAPMGTQPEYISFTVHFDNNGNRLWVQRDPATPLDGFWSFIAVDSGNFTYTVFHKNGGYLYRKIGPAGSIWYSVQMALPASGTIFEDMGIWSGGLVLTGKVATGTTQGYNAVYARYSYSGVLGWNLSYNSPNSGDDEASQLALNPDGSFYAAISTEKLSQLFTRLTGYDASGNLLCLSDLPGFASPTGIACRAGVVAMAGTDSVNHCLGFRICDTAGQVVSTAYSSTDQNGGFKNVDIDSKGNVYVGGKSEISLDGSLIKLSPTGSGLWTGYVGSVGQDTVSRVVVDSSDRVLCLTELPKSGGNVDCAVAAFAPTGGNPVYRHDYEMQGSQDEIIGATSDSAGNTYVLGGRNTGFIYTTSGAARLVKFDASGAVGWTVPFTQPTVNSVWRVFGPLPVPGGLLVGIYTEAGGAQSVVRKYDLNGALVWESPSIPGNFADYFLADSAGGAYLLRGDETLGYTMVRLSSTGTVLWSKQLPSQFYMGGWAVDGSNNVYQVGEAPVPTNSAAELGAIRKIDPNGNVVWLKTFGDNSQVSSGLAVAISTTGRPTLAGILGVGGQRHATVRQFDSAGTQQWATEPTPGSGVTEQILRQIAFDPSGNILVGGNSYRGADSDLLVAKLSGAGANVWSRSYDRTPADTAKAIAVDSSGAAVLTGFGQNPTTGRDYETVKFSSVGDLVWPPSGGVFVNGAAVLDSFWSVDDEPSYVGVDSNRDVYVVGRTTAPGGDPDMHVIKYASGSAAPADSSEFASQTVPTSMTAGQTYSVVVTMTNNGSTTWTSAAGYTLQSLHGSSWGKASVALGSSDSIAPGQSKKFSFSVYAPTTGGAYPMQWQMAKSAVAFGQPSTLVNVPVTVRQHAARYLSQTLPSTVKAGTTFSMTVNMRNTGTLTWTAASGVKLATTDPDLNTIWGSSTVALAAGDSIGQGQDKTFTFNLTAPATPGSYTIRWRMRRDATAFTGFFGDKTTTKTITVTP